MMRSKQVSSRRDIRTCGMAITILALGWSVAWAGVEFTDAISREVTVFNDLTNPIVFTDAVSREVTVFNDLTGTVQFTDAISREVTVFNDLTGTVQFTDAISREISVFSCPGDANGDGIVDPLDSGFVLSRFGCDVNGGDTNCRKADVNGDGIVDPLDVGAVLARFGECPE